MPTKEIMREDTHLCDGINEEDSVSIIILY